ncbi:MAG: hypothetical protein KatS3mg002_1630 [Candidatus Woesearchaeota archaeon]|nr:MAG: hypothetical protein KatS3mg002_1630 [Candidatus Woesearchaeota archaeon]
MNTYKYPSLEEALKYSNLTTLDDGCHNVFAVDFGDIKLVYKSVLSQTLSQTNELLTKNMRGKIKKVLKTIEAPIRNYYSSKIDFMKYREQISDTFDIEYQVLEEWNKRNIPSMRILEKQEKALVYKYLDAINFDKIMRRENHLSPEYTKLLDLITKIRDAAKSENNSLLLHPDLLPKNFLYLLDTKQAIAIDPGLKLKNLPLEELDARINLIFLYDVNKFNHGDGYMNRFLERLTKEEIKNIREFNHPLRKDVSMYFSMRQKILSILRGKPDSDYSYWYNPKNIRHINSVLDKHI